MSASTGVARSLQAHWRHATDMRMGGASRCATMVVHPPQPSQGMLALVPWVQSEYGGRVEQLKSDIAFHIGKQEAELCGSTSPPSTVTCTS